jgi:hypothetical protein
VHRSPHESKVVGVPVPVSPASEHLPHSSDR